MAVAVSGLTWNSAGSETTTAGTLTFSSTYATGGQAITAAALGLGAVTTLEINQGEDGYVFKWDPANSKILIYTVGGFTPAGSISGTAAAQVFTGDAMGVHTHTFTGDALAGHDHTSVIIDATETAGDITAFVPLLDGTGGAVAGTTIGNAGGQGADVLVPSSSDSAGTPTGTNADTSAGTPTGTNAESAITASFTGTPVAAAALAQLANGSSLTGVVTTFRAWGY